MGRPLTITQPFTGSVVYGYDSAGNRLTLKYPDGKVVTDTYDLASRLVQVKDWQAQFTRYTYDSASRLTSLSLPNGITSTYSYDGANRLLALTHQTLTQTVASYTYTLDAVGNRVQVVEGTGTSSPPPAGTITVTTTTDELNTDGDCALREAIRAANLNTAVDACPAGSSSADTIVVPSGTYTLTRNGSDDTAINGDLDITGTVTLQGAGANLTIITGGGSFTDRIFHVLNTTAQFSGVTIQNGKAGSNPGGGLRNAGGAVTLTHSLVVSNTTTGSGDGGGLYNTGTLTLTASAIVSNTAGSSGGGIYNIGGIVTAENSTLSGNRANDDGGGIRNTISGIATLSNLTLTNNTADADGDGAGNGGGIAARSSGTVTTLRNSILAGNQDNSPTTKRPDCFNVVTSQGYTILGNDTGCTYTSGTGDQVGTGSNPINPQLGPLADNGGPTLTHAPQTGSPAIDKGNPATPGSGGNACAANDQRNYARPIDGDTNGSALCDVGAYEVGATGGAIVYLYDPLYRLIAANYGDGATFNYTYDAVGNRLTQTTITNTTVYTYDAANRLINVGGVAQTWDANGNLLNDGVYTYTYDTANRLASAVQGANTYTFTYNGIGDRMRQVAGGITTTYTLDPSAGSGQALNAGLTQVLADGTNTYLYGNGRIAQYAGTTPSYFLGDALGSVRQLANASGAVTLARSYQPYGSVLSSTGTGTTSYAFTGEWQDATNLLHLRARYLSVQTGRFLTRDIWKRSYTRPLSFNAWLYAYADPINLTDPSGQVPCDMLPIEDQIEAGCISPPDVRLTYRGEEYTINGKTGPRPYGGNEVKELYDKMTRSACGWWNAETDGQLTFEEFNGLWLREEGTALPQFEKLVARAVAQNLFVGGWNPPYCPGGVGSCFNGAFNFWAAYSEIVHDQIWAYIRGTTPIEQYNAIGQPEGVYPRGGRAVQVMDEAAVLGHMMLYPPVLDPIKNHGPSNWGNRNAWTKFMNDPANGPVATQGSDQSQIYFTLGNFLVYSVDQYVYWKEVRKAPVDQP